MRRFDCPFDADDRGNIFQTTHVDTANGYKFTSFVMATDEIKQMMCVGKDYIHDQEIQSIWFNASSKLFESHLNELCKKKKLTRDC
jgi:hypothetical protein